MYHERTDANGNKRFLTQEELDAEKAALWGPIMKAANGTSIFGFIAGAIFSLMGAVFVMSKIPSPWDILWVLASIVIMPTLSAIVLLCLRWAGVGVLLIASWAMYQSFG